SALSGSLNWHYDNNSELLNSSSRTMQINELSCAKIEVKIESSENNEDDDVNPTHQMAEKRHRKYHIKDEFSSDDSDDGALQWLRDNWISYILAPILIISFIIGGLAFAVCILNVKDRQDEYRREE
ncbi:hypothetical protein PFISCL1PPCAC_4181, partial [Pristionchus fissidentatus]